jgi:hypothetical protein
MMISVGILLLINWIDLLLVVSYSESDFYCQFGQYYDRFGIRFHSNGLVLVVWLQESYTRLSVTQVINLLWWNGREAGPSQVLLLHRHVSVLKTLLNNSPQLKSFCRESFAEEFR